MTIHPYTRLFVLPSAPTVDEDETEGYEVGDVVYYGGSIYDCLDASSGAAVWQERGADGGLPNPFALTASITPPAITADQNNYFPTGGATADVWYLNPTTGSFGITGIAGGSPNRMLILCNINPTNYMELRTESTSSDAENRLISNFQPAKLGKLDTLILMYDASVSRWRVFTHHYDLHSHNNLSADGGTVSHTYLVGIGTNTHAQIDAHLASAHSTFNEAGRLTKSGSNLLFAPFKGNTIKINGAMVTIPDAGVTLAPTSLSADTTYFIYAYVNSGTLTLEASTTTHATQAGTGVEIKSGDATRSLVGMARTITGPAWVDDATRIGVLSYFNRGNKSAVAPFTANRTTASNSWVELSSEIRISFLTWADESVQFNLGGSGSNGATNGFNTTSFGIDSTTTPEDTLCGSQAYTAGATVSYNLAFSKNGISEAYHYVTVLARAFTGTGTWLGNSTPGDRVAQTITVRG